MKGFAPTGRPRIRVRRPRARARRSRPFAEALEERLAFSVFTVTNVNDTGAGSLRQAILDANAAPGPDAINFDPGVFSTPRTISIISPPPQIGGVLTITGPGAQLLTVRRTASGPLVSGFTFLSFATQLTLSGMTVTGGNMNGDGGGLSVNGVRPDVTLDGMVFTGNRASGNGGGISLTNGATLTLRNSIVSGNTAGKLGGGVFFFQDGSLLVENSTIADNVANGTTGNNSSGGGLYFFGTAAASPPAGFLADTLVLRNSTISGNTAFRSGGGVAVDTFFGALLVENSTISGNTSGYSGGGVAQTDGGGWVTVRDSTVAANAAYGAAAGSGGGGVARVSTDVGAIHFINTVVSGNTNANAPDVLASPATSTDATSSAIGSAAGFTLAGGSANNLPFGVDPMLGPLADNGGPTHTHALLAGSPLINAGNVALLPASIMFDQRGPGFPRVSGGRVDIGAFERVEPPQPVTVTRVFLGGPGLTSALPNADQRAYRTAVGVDNTYGYPVPTGAAQLRAFPLLGGIISVAIRFSEDVGGIIDQGDLVVKGVRTATYPITGFTYDPAVRTATWMLRAPPVNRDGLHLVLAAASLPGLDGEWADGADAYPSGDGAPGGDFDFAVSLLGGDATGDGRVNALDLSFVKQRLNKTAMSPGVGPGAYSPFADVNGDGKINALDASAVKQRLNQSLPLA